MIGMGGWDLKKGDRGVGFNFTQPPTIPLFPFLSLVSHPKNPSQSPFNFSKPTSIEFIEKSLGIS